MAVAQVDLTPPYRVGNERWPHACGTIFRPWDTMSKIRVISPPTWRIVRKAKEG